MRIMVTGGAGLLGSHLCDRLLDMGHEVLAVDNLYTGSKRNIQQHFGNPKFDFLRHDVKIPLFVEVDAIYNLACPASPVHYQKAPVQTIKTSVLGAINMLGLARRLKIPILQASTSEVYGDPTISPQHESYWGNVNPIGVRSCYDEGKRAAESLFFDYWREYGVEIKVARIFNTYGPRMALDDGRVVSNLVLQNLRQQPLSLFGDGSQTRSFCFVSDLVEGLTNLMGTDAQITGPINLGNPNEISMIDLAKEIMAITGYSSDISFLPLPLDDPKQRKPDITRAKQLLMWEPKVSLKEGLTKTISDFLSRL